MNYKISRLNPFGLLLEPQTSHAQVSALKVEHLRQLFLQEQLLILRGFTTFANSAEFANYCESWGEISLWPFGKVLELVAQDKPQDHIFAHSYVPLHWDGMYRPQIPEVQIFHCVKAPLRGQGGRTTFTNTRLAVENASISSIKLWDKVTGSYQRTMEFYDSKTVSPIIDKHPYRDFLVIRYNEPPQEHLVNPPTLEFTGLNPAALELFHQDLTDALYSPSNFYAHEWQSGDVVIADNFSLLHGREAFIAQSPRHLQRVHVLSNPPFANPGLECHQ